MDYKQRLFVLLRKSSELLRKSSKYLTDDLAVRRVSYNRKNIHNYLSFVFEDNYKPNNENTSIGATHL